jgi:hypothetical protein
MHPRFSLSRFIRKQGKHFSSNAAANWAKIPPINRDTVVTRIRWTNVTSNRPMVAIR